MPNRSSRQNVIQSPTRVKTAGAARQSIWNNISPDTEWSQKNSAKLQKSHTGPGLGRVRHASVECLAFRWLEIQTGGGLWVGLTITMPCDLRLVLSVCLAPGKRDVMDTAHVCATYCIKHKTKASTLSLSQCLSTYIMAFRDGEFSAVTVHETKSLFATRTISIIL